jgi:hypothetical protein
MDFITALFSKEQQEMMFRVYVSEALKVLTENTGRGITTHYTDLISPKPKDNRSGEEIVADVIKRCGLVVKNN